MNPRRLGLLACLCLACLVLAGCMAPARGSVSRQPATSDCEVEPVFTQTAQLAQELAPLKAEYSQEGTCDLTKLDLLEAEAGRLLEQITAVGSATKHDVSSATLTLALRQYVKGLDELDYGLENRDPTSQTEGMKAIKHGDDLRKDALDQLLDEGSCD